MGKSRSRGFTLVEILIVVVILGILAAIVVPQFTNASQQAIKGALASQLQTVNTQIELYRVQNAGSLPNTDAGDPMLGGGSGGWGILVSGNFLKNQPKNGYTRSSNVAGAWVGAPLTDGTAAGWAYNAATGEVYANGYDFDNNLISNEGAYVDPAPF
jgi:general secretion pathway protein G